MRWLTLALATVLAFAACGGKSTGGAGGGTPDDGSSPDAGQDAFAGVPEPPGECITFGGSTTRTDAGCQATMLAPCGANYEVDCTCPEDTCQCLKNGVQVGTVSYGYCSVCLTPDYSWALCGFPTGEY